MTMTKTIFSAALVAAMACPAVAGEDKQHKQSRQWNQQQDQQVSLQDVRQEVQGEVIDYRTVQIQGQQEPHVLAKVRQQDGRTVVLDLGPVNKLEQQNVRLRQGTQMQASGQPGRINNRPVIIVDRFIGDGQFTMLIPLSQQEMQQAQAQRQQQRQSYQQNQFQQNGFQERQAFQQRDFQPQQQGQAFGQQQRFQAQQRRVGTDVFAQGRPGQQQRQRAFAQQDQVRVEGRITDQRQVQIQGLDHGHQLVKLQTSQGRTVVVDLGEQTLDDLNLSQNDEVMVTGRSGRINDRPVVFAERVAAVQQIDRRKDIQQAQQQQRRQQGQQQNQWRQQQNR